MKINGNAVRPGNVIELRGSLWLALKTQHTQPGKGGAYLQVELKDIRNGTKLNERFRASETVEKARLDEVEKQFLYAEGDTYTFMDPVTYDQVELSREFIGDAVDFLKDGMNVMVQYYEEDPLMVKLPDHVVMEVVEADAVVKGQTASSSYKPAKLENGRRILVPPHIEAGIKIVVGTEEGNYIERAKE